MSAVSPDLVALISTLERRLGTEKVLRGPAAERAYDCDAYTVDRSRPTVVVLPETTAEVQSVIALCREHEVPYTARGAGTGLSGGALPALGGVVISTKRMTRILAVDISRRAMHAQVGVTNKRLSDEVTQFGLHFAPDPSSQTVATLGGNIAENSGGPHTLKYGVTAPHVRGLTVVTPDADVLVVGGADGRTDAPDLTALYVGSEGLLGVVTEAWVNLTPLPKAVETALIAFPQVRGATESVAEIIGQGVIPAALELIDHGILVALRAAFNLQYPDAAQALMLVELDGDDPGRVKDELAQVVTICQRRGCIDVAVAANERERAQLWLARKKGVGAMGRLAPTVVTHDGVIPRSKLPQMLERVYAVAEEHGLNVANIFHAGDGNLHPCFYFDDRIPGKVEAVVAAGEALMRECLALGGSITGEHGIGVEKMDLMADMFSPDDLAFQARIRDAFDRSRLCNPCKVLPNQKSCVEHKSRWRGSAW